MGVAVVFALLGGFAFAVSTVLQQRAAQRRPAAESLRLRLLIQLARDPVWLAGIATGIAGFGCQAAALTLGTLTLVQPLLVTDLLWALPIASRLSGRQMGAREWGGAGLVVGGLATCLTVAAPQPGRDQPIDEAWVGVGIAIAALVAASVLSAGRFSGALRAMCLAVGAGAVFGGLAALTKASTDLVADHGFLVTMTRWQPYVLLAAGILSMLLAASAFQAGPLAASLPILDSLEPMTAVLIGIVAFRDKIDTSIVGLGLEAVGVVAVLAGIWLLDHSPLVLARAPGQPSDPPRSAQPATC